MQEAPYEKDILLAEDDADDVFLFELALKELNAPYILRHASNGDVLFVLLKEKTPYILFLDVQMPCKGGVACVVDIRKNRDYDSLPIIMYTSNFSDKIVEDCYRNGANLYLTKTNTFAELTEKLRKIFAHDWDQYLQYPPQSQFVS